MNTMNMISVILAHTACLALRNGPGSPLPSVEGNILCGIICICQRISPNVIILVKGIVENTCVNLFCVPQ